MYVCMYLCGDESEASTDLQVSYMYLVACICMYVLAGIKCMFLVVYICMYVLVWR